MTAEEKKKSRRKCRSLLRFESTTVVCCRDGKTSRRSLLRLEGLQPTPRRRRSRRSLRSHLNVVSRAGGVEFWQYRTLPPRRRIVRAELDSHHRLRKVPSSVHVCVTAKCLFRSSMCILPGVAPSPADRGKQQRLQRPSLKELSRNARPNAVLAFRACAKIPF